MGARSVLAWICRANFLEVKSLLGRAGLSLLPLADGLSCGAMQVVSALLFAVIA